MSSLHAGLRSDSATTSLLRENQPHPRRTMEALRQLGYDSYACVEDLLDNCIDAGAIRVSVRISEHKGDIRISIQDDGCGMNEETLDEALRLGSDLQHDVGDLGKFGMALVTASIALSRRVEVYTKESDGALLLGGFDLDQIYELGRFVKFVGPTSKEEESAFPLPQGTMIVLSKTDKISNRNTTDFANILRKRLGQIFRKFLKAGLAIDVNGSKVEPVDPLMLSHPDTRLVLEADIEVSESGSASLRVVELPDLGAGGNKAHGIGPDKSGFYVVRNNREIMEAQTFDFYKKHPEYAHFRAELSFTGELDQDFQTDVKKKSINPSQGFLDKLKQATMALITSSQREKKRRSNVDRGKVDHSTAESNIEKRAKLLPKPPALIEKRQVRGTRGTNSRGSGDRQRTPHVTIRTVSGLRVQFNEGDFGEESPFYLVNQEGRTITVTYNREHPFWRELVEHADDPKVVAILDYLVFALANSELLVPEPAGVVKSNVNATLVGLLV